MPKYEIEYYFSMRCNTRNIVIDAASKADAVRIAKRAIVGDTLDSDILKEHGARMAFSSWDTHDCSDHDYELSEVRELEDEEEEEEEDDA